MNQFKKGDKFLVKKGMQIFTTSRRGTIFAKKNYWVILNDFYPGYGNRPSVVEWVGRGGYWYRVKLNAD